VEAGGFWFGGLGYVWEIDGAANAIEGEVMPDHGIALPEEVPPGECGAGFVDIERGRGAGVGKVAEADIVERDGIEEAAIHWADGKAKAVSPGIEGEGLADGIQKGGGIKDDTQEDDEDEEKEERALARAAARAEGRMLLLMGCGMQGTNGQW